MSGSILGKTRLPARTRHRMLPDRVNRRGRYAQTPAAAPVRFRKPWRKNPPVPCRIEAAQAGTTAASDGSSAMRSPQVQFSRCNTNTQQPSGRYRQSYDKIPRQEAGDFDNHSAASGSKGAPRADLFWAHRSNRAYPPCKFQRPAEAPGAVLL